MGPQNQVLACFLRKNGNLLPVSPESSESDDSVDLCEKRKIISKTDILSRMNSGSILPVEHIARLDELAVRSLCTKSLRIRISTVFGRAHTLMMSHIPFPPSGNRSGDRIDLHLCEELPVSVLLVITGLSLIAVDDDLLPLAVLCHGPGDLGAFHIGLSELQAAVVQ